MSKIDTTCQDMLKIVPGFLNLKKKYCFVLKAANLDWIHMLGWKCFFSLVFISKLFFFRFHKINFSMSSFPAKKIENWLFSHPRIFEKFRAIKTGNGWWDKKIQLRKLRSRIYEVSRFLKYHKRVRNISFDINIQHFAPQSESSKAFDYYLLLLA